MANYENYIDTNEARKRLGCSAQTIRNLIKVGKINAVQLENGRFLIDEISLQNYQDNKGKEVIIAKNANPKAKILHNTRPKAVENPSNQLVIEIREQHGSRPEWPDLYQTLLETDVSLDGFVLECVFRTPESGIECFSSTPAYTLPDDPFRFEDELFIDWHNYDLTVETAKNYLATDFRWWTQLTYLDKVIIRSRDEKSPTSDLGLRAWLDDQEEAIKDEREMLRAQNKRRGQETIGSLALCGGAVVLGLLLGLTGKSRPSS
jgi:hypothetical protein